MRRSVQAGGAALVLWLLLGLAALVAAAPPSAAETAAGAGAEITPHRGIYVLDLLRARSSSGIVGVRGAAYFEWAKSCKGYLVNQHVRMQLALSEGQSSVAVLIFSSLETADGRSMSFKLRQLADGVVTEELEGVAELGPEGGVAHFSVPERKDVRLPPGTLFPTAYTRRALGSMVAGEPLFASLLFDGSTADGAYQVTTFFGHPTNRPAPGAKAGEQAAFWPNRAGYFAAGSVDAEPLFEVGSSISAGGVAEWFDLDYGNFSVRAALADFEALPDPHC